MGQGIGVFRCPGNDDEKPGKPTGNNEYIEHSLKRMLKKWQLSKRTVVFKISKEKTVVRIGLHIGGKETEQMKECW